MPMYSFQRPDGSVVAKKLTFSDYDAVREGAKEVLDEDGSKLELVFDPSQVGFVMKDGVSGGWASKALKENKYRAGRSKEMERRQKDHVFKSKLIPNYKGQEASSWTEVRDHVRSVDGERAASTYNPLVTQEGKK